MMISDDDLGRLWDAVYDMNSLGNQRLHAQAIRTALEELERMDDPKIIEAASSALCDRLLEAWKSKRIE